ncbi:MAG: cytochrome C, partial [Acidobacteria bacterium]|nr:cytochrome C [Acidobacteriota bacterium]
EAMYGIEHFDYEWVPVERHMGIFHEVQPADNALRCLDCHGPDGRLDWAGLGYEADPLAEWFTASH